MKSTCTNKLAPPKKRHFAKRFFLFFPLKFSLFSKIKVNLTDLMKGKHSHDMIVLVWLNTISQATYRLLTHWVKYLRAYIPQHEYVHVRQSLSPQTHVSLSMNLKAYYCTSLPTITTLMKLPKSPDAQHTSLDRYKVRINCKSKSHDSQTGSLSKHLRGYIP